MPVLLAVALWSHPVDWGLGAGLTGSTDVRGGGLMVRGRAGLSIGWFTPSLSAFLAPITTQPCGEHQQCDPPDGFSGWGVAADLRAHTTTPGLLRFYAAFGVGVGQVWTLQD